MPKRLPEKNEMGEGAAKADLDVNFTNLPFERFKKLARRILSVSKDDLPSRDDKQDKQNY